jgi:hypothetical protein
MTTHGTRACRRKNTICLDEERVPTAIESPLAHDRSRSPQRSGSSHWRPRALAFSPISRRFRVTNLRVDDA